MHPEYQFKSHFAVIQGNNLHYIDEGQGPVIVMVHGNPTWSFFYRKAIEQLKKQYRVIAFDNIGCGLSDKPQKYNYCLSNHVANMAALLDQLGISSFSLIVHDWGGAIGLSYAVDHIHKIEKVVILNSAAFRSKKIPLRIRICGLPVLGKIIVRGLNGFAFPATFMAVSKKLDRETKHWYLAPYNSWANRIAIHQFVKDIPLYSKHPSYERLKETENKLQHIRENKIPILILWGGKDFCFTPYFYHRWKEIFPNAESFLFENGGHYILEDEYNQIEAIFDRFFEKEK